MSKAATLNDPEVHEWMALDLTRYERHDELIALLVRTNYTEPLHIMETDYSGNGPRDAYGNLQKVKRHIGERVWSMEHSDLEARYQQPVPGARKLAVRHSDIELETILLGTAQAEKQYISSAYHLRDDQVRDYIDVSVFVVGVILTAPMRALEALQHFEAVASTAVANWSKDVLKSKRAPHKVLLTNSEPSAPLLAAFTHNGAKAVLMESPDAPLRPLNFEPANG
jgi:hypothetical protein